MSGSATGTVATGGSVAQPTVAFGSSLTVMGAGRPGPGTAYAVNAAASSSTLTITGNPGYAVGQAIILGGTTAPTNFTLGSTYYVVSASYSSPTFTFTLSATYGGSAISAGASAGSNVTVQALVGGTTLLLDPAQKITNGANTEVCRIAAPRPARAIPAVSRCVT